MQKKGLFVVFEGIDGSGTSTHVHKLQESLEGLNKYQDVLRTHEPWRSDKIKRKLESDKDAYSDAREMSELYIDDRAHHTKKLIRPVRDSGAIVLCSRYKMSTCAYQWVQGIPLVELLETHEDRGLLTPDLTFLLGVPQKVAEERIKTRKRREKFESREFMGKLIHAYDALFHMSEVDPRIFGKVVRINSDRKTNKVADEIYQRFIDVYSSR